MQLEKGPGMQRRIGFVQFEPRFGDRDGNHRDIARLAEQGAGADLLVFPELAASGYEFRDVEEVRQLAEPFATGPTSELMQGIAARIKTTVVIGYPERDRESFFNSSILATPEGRLVNYRKIHLFSRETQLFSRGDAMPPVTETPAGRVGMMICFDWVFPEAARVLALAGAQIIAHPANLVLQYCQRAMFARSVENCVYSVTANRIGTEARAGRSLTFTGASQILSPKGEMLAHAPMDVECVEVVDVDVSRADDKHMTEYNDLFADRRTDLYSVQL